MLQFSWNSLCCTFSLSAMATEKSELQVLEGNREFTTSLYKVLAETPGNVFFSPISVHVVLSMCYQGAKGTTAEKFASSLKVPTAAAAAEGYSVVMNRLNSIPNVTLLMANKILWRAMNSCQNSATL